MPNNEDDFIPPAELAALVEGYQHNRVKWCKDPSLRRQFSLAELEGIYHTAGNVYLPDYVPNIRRAVEELGKLQQTENVPLQPGKVVLMNPEDFVNAVYEAIPSVKANAEAVGRSLDEPIGHNSHITMVEESGFWGDRVEEKKSPKGKPKQHR